MLISMSLRKGVSLALSVDFVRVVRGLTELWAPTSGDVDFRVAAIVDVEVSDLLLDPNLRGPAKVETESCGNAEVRFGMLDRNSWQVCLRNWSCGGTTLALVQYPSL
jgi:hypothetical protein